MVGIAAGVELAKFSSIMMYILYMYIGMVRTVQFVGGGECNIPVYNLHFNNV
jgi:hypothetical protein